MSAVAPTIIRDELVKLIREQLNVSNGYENDVDGSKVYSYWSASIADNTLDESYPKIFVILEGGNLNQLAFEHTAAELTFAIIIIVKKVADTQNAQEMVESYLEDFVRFFQLNHTLSGTVQDAKLVEFVTDGGVKDPEGIAILRVKTERHSFGE